MQEEYDLVMFTMKKILEGIRLDIGDLKVRQYIWCCRNTFEIVRFLEVCIGLRKTMAAENIDIQHK